MRLAVVWLINLLAHFGCHSVSSFIPTSPSSHGSLPHSPHYSTTAPTTDASNAGVTTAEYSNLLTWLNTTFPTSYVHPSIAIAPSTRGGGTGGHGAFATSPLSKDELVFRIPREACVTSQDVWTDPDCGAAFQSIIKKTGPGGFSVCLAGYLAKEYLVETAEGGKASKFGPYLATLPWKRNINGQEHVLFWEEKEVREYLTDSLCWGESRDLRDEVKVARKLLNSVLGPTVLRARMSDAQREREDAPLIPFLKWTKPPPQPVTEPVPGLGKAVTGAFVILLTRAFDDGSDEENGVDAVDRLVPVLDMLNHDNDPTVTHKIDSTDGSVEVRTVRNVESGEELFNRYREEEEMNMPYHRFFSRFGFVPGLEEDVKSLLKDKSSIFFAKRGEI